MLNESTESRLRRRLGDRGYAVALTGLLLLPMLGFTALAVDLGSWYARAAAIQRATDAAALAGVTALPDGGFPQAELVARQVAAQNGFVHDGGTIFVIAERVGDDRLQVTITDEDVPQYFTRVFRGDDDVSISRGAVAEYAPPVRMGSPRNFLGTNFLDGYGASPEGFTLSVRHTTSMPVTTKVVPPMLSTRRSIWRTTPTCRLPLATTLRPPRYTTSKLASRRAGPMTC